MVWWMDVGGLVWRCREGGILGYCCCIHWRWVERVVERGDAFNAVEEDNCRDEGGESRDLLSLEEPAFKFVHDRFAQSMTCAFCGRHELRMDKTKAAWVQG